jgi:hypothetical protein
MYQETPKKQPPFTHLTLGIRKVKLSLSLILSEVKQSLVEDDKQLFRRFTMKSILRPRSFGMLILALILAASVYGFAAANTFPDGDTYAGEGSANILGYAVTNVTYGLTTADADPSDIDQVTFTLNAAASDAYVSFDGGSTWSPCSISGGTSVTCSPLSIPVLGASSLGVIAVD